MGKKRKSISTVKHSSRRGVVVTPASADILERVKQRGQGVARRHGGGGGGGGVGGCCHPTRRTLKTKIRILRYWMPTSSEARHPLRCEPRRSKPSDARVSGRRRHKTRTNRTSCLPFNPVHNPEARAVASFASCCWCRSQ